MLQNRTGEWYDPFAKSRPDEKTEKPEKVELEADFINKASKAAEAHADANYPDEAARMARTKDERNNPVTPQHSEEWVKAFQDKYNGLTADYNARRSGKEGRPVVAPAQPGKEPDLQYDPRKQREEAESAAMKILHSDLPEETKNRAAYALKQGADMLAKVGGDFNKLSPDERKEYIKYMRSIQGVVVPPPPPPAPPPVPPVTPNQASPATTSGGPAQELGDTLRRVNQRDLKDPSLRSQLRRALGLE
jgi:hypothetical protein